MKLKLNKRNTKCKKKTNKKRIAVGVVVVVEIFKSLFPFALVTVLLFFFFILLFLLLLVACEKKLVLLLQNK